MCAASPVKRHAEWSSGGSYLGADDVARCVSSCRLLKHELRHLSCLSTTTQTPITHHSSPITQHPYPSPNTHHASPNRVTHHPTPITHHASRITHHPYPITQHPSPHHPSQRHHNHHHAVCTITRPVSPSITTAGLLSIAASKAARYSKTGRSFLKHRPLATGVLPACSLTEQRDLSY